MPRKRPLSIRMTEAKEKMERLELEMRIQELRSRVRTPRRRRVRR